MTYQTMCALRMYLRRGDMTHAMGFWRRLFRRPLATHLIHEAMKAGITHAALNYGNMGFARGAKLVASDVTEIPFDTLPVCVELVGPKPLLDQFVRDHKKQLADATLVMLEGVHVQSMIAEDTPSRPPVEYVKIGTSPESVRAPAGQIQATLVDPEPVATE